jgi:MFS transporter, CP family, cyanate transporter
MRRGPGRAGTVAWREMPESAAPPGLSPPRPGHAARNTVLLVVSITALAFNLRAAITSLPPLFPELSASLHLPSAAIAALASLPVLTFGVFSWLAAPLSRRFGEEWVLGGALALLAVSLLLRGAWPDSLLFPGTALAGVAISLLNVLLPSLTKRRRPHQAGLVIGIYMLSMSAGSILASLIAVPVYQASRNSVPLSLGLWAIPAAAAALLWLPQWRYRTRPAAAAPATGLLKVYRYALTWQITLYMGLQSLTFYAVLSWLPTMLRARGESPGGAGTLLALTGVGSAISSLAVPTLAHRFRDQRALVVGTAVVTGAGLAGCWFAPLGSAVWWALVLGMGQSASLGLAIYFTMARAPDPVAAASLSAFAQSVGYLVAALGPLLTGFLHSATGGWTVPVACLLVIIGLQLVTGGPAARGIVLPSAGTGPT